MAEPYSTLQVAPPHPSDYGGLHLPDYSGLQADTTNFGAAHAAETEKEYIDGEPRKPPPPRLICGLAAGTFWAALAIIVTIVVVGAAVGGGVGGSIAAKNNRKANSVNGSSSSAPMPAGSIPSSISSATPTPSSPLSSSSPVSSSSAGGPITSAPSSTAAPVVTTTPVTGPSTTLLRDCPSSNNTLYSPTVDDTMAWRKICGLSYRNDRGVYAIINQLTTSLDDCIDLCADHDKQNKAGIAAGTSPLCNAVCWRDTFSGGEAWPGRCFGYTTLNSSSAFVVESEGDCDSAAWINQVF